MIESGRKLENPGTSLVLENANSHRRDRVLPSLIGCDFGPKKIEWIPAEGGGSVHVVCDRIESIPTQIGSGVAIVYDPIFHIAPDFGSKIDEWIPTF